MSRSQRAFIIGYDMQGVYGHPTKQTNVHLLKNKKFEEKTIFKYNMVVVCGKSAP